MFKKFINTMVFVSVGLYFLEVSLNLQGSGCFLWMERIIATIFTWEIYYQWKNEKNYTKSFEFYVDILAILPFWLGFFIPVEYLGLIRTLRVLRLFKLFWTCESFEILINTFKRSWPMLRSAAIITFAIILFGASVLYQLEPENFLSIGNTLYFCFTTACTVGFGDFSPKTPMGKIVTIGILYGPALLICGAVVGIVGSAYQVSAEEFHKNRIKK